MKSYSTNISLIKNSRGVYILDPLMGCASGLKNDNRGCFSDCYAAKSAKIYGYDFSKTIKRDFKSRKHLLEIGGQIRKIELPFVRMGGSCDPSENWEHTLNICGQIQPYLIDNQLSFFTEQTRKAIIIITKHWQIIPVKLLHLLSKYGVIVNTSISAIDNDSDLQQKLMIYHALKQWCNSVLRVVTFDFNTKNELGHKYSIVQQKLLQNENVIDTVFRPNKSNKLIIDGIINAKPGKFMNSIQLLSKHNRKTYIGNCGNCLEMCGATMLQK